MNQLFKQSAQLLVDFAELHADDIFKSATTIGDRLKNGGTLLICGNGGSAADSQHFAAEMVGRLGRDRPPISAVALTTDTSILTAVGNDYDFSTIFQRQVEALASANDVLVVLSTSGNSKNVITAVESARRIGLYTIALLGKDGGKLAHLVDTALVVQSPSSQLIQQVHITVIHAWCEIIEDILYPIQSTKEI
ncbi:SIS domain-containing protein [candidate division KSB1 bacterium]|nr:MAG: SIS domain-containing protein [candidate division KSB1 bacterium]